MEVAAAVADAVAEMSSVAVDGKSRCGKSAALSLSWRGI